MPHAENSHIRKGLTLVLVVLWVAWSIGRAQGALDPGDVVLAGYTAYELFSYATIYAFARLHDLEVQNILGSVAPVDTSQDDSRANVAETPDEDPRDDSEG